MPFDILHALGLAAALAVAYSLGTVRRLYCDEEWRDGVRGRLDAWNEANPPVDSGEVVEQTGKVGLVVPTPYPADPRVAWYEGYKAGQRSTLAPGIRERLAAGAEGGREIEWGKVLG